MKLAVIGAGWAGLAAASELHHLGHEVHVFESSRTPGGRARKVQTQSLGNIDNGQHLLIGAYSETLALIARDVPQSEQASLFFESALWLESADARFKLKINKSWPQAMQAPLALWLAKGLSLADKWQASLFLRRVGLSQNPPTDDITVTQWLATERQTEALGQWLWKPLCLASLNTEPDHASAALFHRVIKDSLTSPDPRATDLLIPATDLSSLWPDHVAQKVTCHFGRTVRHVRPTEHVVFVDDECFDGCVIATPAWGLHRLFSPETSKPLRTHLEAAQSMTYLPITTCYVDLAGPLTLPAPMLLLDHSAQVRYPGQWVFDRNAATPQALTQAPTQAQAKLAFVISDAQSVLGVSDQALAELLLAQLGSALEARYRRAIYLPPIKATSSIHEKRATFAAVPGLKRPTTETPWPHLMLAGDWTDTGYPAVLEGAVRSGLAAAARLNERR
jgi:squalene-associated FAD-dependent desaturase